MHIVTISNIFSNRYMRDNQKLCYPIKLHIPDYTLTRNYPSLSPRRLIELTTMSISPVHSKMLPHLHNHHFPLFLPVCLISRCWKLNVYHKLKTFLLDLTSTNQLPSFLRTAKLLLTEAETVKKNNPLLNENNDLE